MAGGLNTMVKQLFYCKVINKVYRSYLAFISMVIFMVVL